MCRPPVLPVQLTNHVLMVLPAAAIGIICGLCAILFTLINLKVRQQRSHQRLAVAAQGSRRCCAHGHGLLSLPCHATALPATCSRRCFQGHDFSKVQGPARAPPCIPLP